VEKIVCIVKDSYCNDPLGALSKHIRHLYDICLILKQDNYQNFVRSHFFESLISKCIADERRSSVRTSLCLEQPIINAPLFSNFKNWREFLKKIYHGDFANFVYGHLPTLDEIEDSLMFIKENFKKKKCVLSENLPK